MAIRPSALQLSLLLLSLTAAVRAAPASSSSSSPTAVRCASAGLSFSGVFTHNAVLQRAPQLASLYGCAGNASLVAGATVLLTFEGTEGGGGGAVNMTLPGAVASDGSWKITLPRAFATGGTFSASIACAACRAGSPWWQEISNLTFGDVSPSKASQSQPRPPSPPRPSMPIPP